MGRMQRQKGATFERLVANAIKARGLEARRGIGQARSASEVADVQVSGWWVECKHQINPRPLQALEQARMACLASKHPELRPVAICKPNRRTPTATWVEWLEGFPIIVTADFADWLEMVARQQAGGGHG